MEEFLRNIGIEYKGNKASDGCYVIDLDEDQWARCYSILENTDELEQDMDSSNVTYESSTQQYMSDEFIITLIGDYSGDTDTFRLTIKTR